MKAYIKRYFSCALTGEELGVLVVTNGDREIETVVHQEFAYNMESMSQEQHDEEQLQIEQGI
tara:strand:- start:297 stop:482 length:186 start_codon:yes stop_codon:yes gene_type:complete